MFSVRLFIDLRLNSRELDRSILSYLSKTVAEFNIRQDINIDVLLCFECECESWSQKPSYFSASLYVGR